MSARLDKSLDEIISTRRGTSGRGRGRRVHRTAPTATAPVGGVKKNPKHAKGAVKNVPTGPSGSSGEGKILVTGFVSIIAACPKSHLLTQTSLRISTNL
jgi:THO complex subunit 4